MNETGFYYFIFANENEITDNFLSATFDLHKTVFDVSAAMEKCLNVTECSFPLRYKTYIHPFRTRTKEQFLSSFPGSSPRSTW